MDNFESVLKDLIRAFEEDGRSSWAAELRPLIGSAHAPDEFLRIARHPEFGGTLEEGKGLDLLWQARNSASEIRHNRSAWETLRLTRWSDWTWAIVVIASIVGVVTLALILPLIQAIRAL